MHPLDEELLLDELLEEELDIISVPAVATYMVTIARMHRAVETFMLFTHVKVVCLVGE